MAMALEELLKAYENLKSVQEALVDDEEIGFLDADMLRDEINTANTALNTIESVFPHVRDASRLIKKAGENALAILSGESSDDEDDYEDEESSPLWNAIDTFREYAIDYSNIESVLDLVRLSWEDCKDSFADGAQTCNFGTIPVTADQDAMISSKIKI